MTKKIALLALAIGSLHACSSPTADIPAGLSALPNPNLDVGRVAPETNYRVGIFDELKIIVFREPELSVDRAVVDPAGRIAVPTIGQINAFGATVDELSDQIRSQLNARYLRNAEVVVSVTKASSYVFAIEGEVDKPGVYSIPGKTSLLQAIAIGEGFTEKARLKDVIIFREQGGQRYAAKFNIGEIRAGRAEDPLIRPGDTVVVGYSVAKQIYKDIITALPGVAGIFVALNQN